MDFAVEQLGPGCCAVRASGELDLATTPEFEAVVKKVLAHPPELLVFDLSDLTYINSTGIYVLLKADIRLAQKGGKTVIVAARPEVRVTLDLVGVPQRIHCVSSLAEARAPLTRKSHACRSNA